jgi:hypothetical protein
MTTKSHQVNKTIMVLSACALIPSIASAHGVTAQAIAPFFLLADFLVLVLAIPAYLLSKKIAMRLSTLFAGINIAITILGILASILTSLENAPTSSSDDLSFDICCFTTSYVWIAVPIHLLLLLIWAGVRSRLNRNRALKESD